MRACAASRLIIIIGVVFIATSAVPALAASSSFSSQLRMGFTVGDQWEPAIAADQFGDVYILYPQYGKVPGCVECSNPTMVLVVSKNNGESWEAPRPIYLAGSPQFDAQIAVDPINGRTVYAAWLQNDRKDAIIARSDDFGASWKIAIAARMNAALDKPALAVRGADVYLGFSYARKLWVASSHDGAHTFSWTTVNPEAKSGWAVPGGAVVDPSGSVYFSWAEYIRSGTGNARVNLYVSGSVDRGQSWTSSLLDRSASPPDCSAYKCEWGHLGAQIAISSDTAGTLYALWNAGARNGAAERIYFASSTAAGQTWSARSEVSSAARGVEHCFPALAAGAAGDVRIAWIDTRNQGFWNVYYRNSTNGGATWSGERRLSGYVPGYSYIRRKGFYFPFGDYFGIAIDNLGDTQAVWGEGLNFQSPGSIWYANGR